MSCLKCTFIEQNPKDYHTKCDKHEFFNVMPIKPKHHQGNGRHNGSFAGTLTMSWDWNENEDTMVEAIKSILYQDTCPVKKFRWNLEYCGQEASHTFYIRDKDWRENTPPNFQALLDILVRKKRRYGRRRTF